MKIRKPNNNYPITNNQKSDKVVIDGLMTAEDLTQMGQSAGLSTIEQLKAMYPKNTEAELKEIALMDDEQFANKLRQVSEYNKENIEAYYNNQILKDEIHKTRVKIQDLEKQYKKTKENNLIYEKDAEIRRLKEKIEKMQAKATIE